MELSDIDSDGIIRSTRDHILIDEEDIDKYKILRDKLPFKNNVHAFSLAVFVGYYSGNSPKKVNKSYNGFAHLSVYKNSPYLNYLKTFAISHENDPLILVDEKRMFDICEGYARTGIDILLDWIDSKDEPLENVLAKEIIEKFDELNVE